MELTAGQITTALEIHGHEHRTSDTGAIEAYEVSTTRGADGVVRDSSRWVPAPTTQREMLDWLGY